jgi:hypothetical protein
MATDETASPQRPIEPELEAVKQALAAREAEVRSLRQLLDARTSELAVRNTAYREQIEHQAATVDVLKAMSASPGDPQPVFDLIVRRARELCSAASAALIEYDGELVHFRAWAGRETFGAPSDPKFAAMLLDLAYSERTVALPKASDQSFSVGRNVALLRTGTAHLYELASRDHRRVPDHSDQLALAAP